MGGKREKMEKNKQLASIIKLLAHSVKSKLNASLTPEDCHFLLVFILTAQKNIEGSPLEPIFNKLSSIAERAIDSLEDMIEREMN